MSLVLVCSVEVIEGRISFTDNLSDLLILLLLPSRSMLANLSLRDLYLRAQISFDGILLTVVLILIVVVVELPNSPVGSTIFFGWLTEAEGGLLSSTSCSSSLVSFLIFCRITCVLRGSSCSRGGPAFSGRGS